MAQYARQTARPCRIQDLLEGEWIEQAEQPNGIKTAHGLISRASVFGIVVDHPSSQSILLNDSTGQITVRTFEADVDFSKHTVGAFVLVVGRPRTYNNEKYVVAEICKQHDMAWSAYRKKELELRVPEVTEDSFVAADTIPETIQVPDTGANPFEQIVALIKEFDDGGGASVEDVLGKLDHPEGEQFIHTLIEEGEIFEIKPGRMKVLE